MEWINRLFDSRIFMKINALAGFVLVGIFIFFYFSKEGKDERGRGLIATASLVSYAMLFILLNIGGYLLMWAMDNIVRLANLIQTIYTLFLLTADIVLLILRKIR